MRTMRVVHEDEEFYVVDVETAGEGRTVTVLVPVDRAPPPGGGRPLVTTNKGPHVALARWRNGGVEALTQLTDQHLETLKAVLEKYLTGLLEGDRTRGAAFYYNACGQEMEFAIAHSHPHGLVVQVYSRREQAESSALRSSHGGQRFDTRRTNDLTELLTRAANEGYAGAVLNDCDPIYFCIDPHEQIRFLKLSQNEEEEIEESLLKNDGAWRPRSDSEDLELYVNQDACDRNMVRCLGEIPFLRDVPQAAAPEDAAAADRAEAEDGLFYTIEEPSSPGRLKSFDVDEASLSMSDSRIAALFAGRRPALDFMAGSRESFDVVAVTDLKAFVKHAARENLLVVLGPGSHRAMTGFLWSHDEDIILDSFSGFWRMTDDNRFVRLADG